ncbi:MAG: nicotinamide-nucleotide adenylyltransferase [Candidatus Diapherotrites archaeon]|nr:nicotinamide-nucleotide adenylyltransferase [Candidatus Diapherotrites archaeon]
MSKTKNEKKRGVIIGRFQPYHLGHHNAVKNILAEMDELVIVIGSSDDSYNLQNPFTSGERLEIISGALKKDGLYEKCFIAQVPDVNENSLWTSKIISYCPTFEVVYTNNPLVRQLFEKAGYRTKKMVSNLKDIDGVKIRQLMLSGKDWKKLVPASAADYLEKIGAEQRIKAIIEKEEKE